MNDIDTLLKEAKNTLYDNEIVKEFFRIKKIIENDEEISTLRKEMILHEKNMTFNMNNDDVYFKEKNLYEETKSRLDNHPLIIDYEMISNEVYDLLLEVKQILN